MQTVFTLASGRSGTHFLYEVIHRNAIDCVARHEPYVTNPSMFGKPIYDHACGKIDSIRELLEKKRRVIERFAPRTYVETSHAFLKSYFDLAPEYFPEMKLVHLVRNPLKTAKSLANREDLIHRLRLPFCHYRGDDGCWYFRWALTGLEPIYQNFDKHNVTSFQRLLLEWIEIENRSIQFLDRFDKHADCVTLHAPAEINDPERLREMFERLGLKMRNDTIDLAGRTNKTPGLPTVITDDEERQFAEVVKQLPQQYKSIFAAPPYSQWEWSKRFQ